MRIPYSEGTNLLTSSAEFRGVDPVRDRPTTSTDPA